MNKSHDSSASSPILSPTPTVGFIISFCDRGFFKGCHHHGGSLVALDKNQSWALLREHASQEDKR